MAILTSGTIGDYEVSIPVDTLSRVFQDALHVTAALGYAYIWIDSLCIVQDDEAEWQGESEAMHTIYRNAVCNLAASEFENGEEGLLNDHRARNPIGPVVDSLWSEIQAEGSAPGTAKSRRQAAKRVIVIEDQSTERIRNGPLFRRAWVLQEQILVRNSRTLLFHSLIFVRLLELCILAKNRYFGNVTSSRPMRSGRSEYSQGIGAQLSAMTTSCGNPTSTRCYSRR